MPGLPTGVCFYQRGAGVFCRKKVTTAKPVFDLPGDFQSR